MRIGIAPNPAIRHSLVNDGLLYLTKSPALSVKADEFPGDPLRSSRFGETSVAFESESSAHVMVLIASCCGFVSVDMTKAYKRLSDVSIEKQTVDNPNALGMIKK
jgi:hypothetical protein